MRLKPNMKRRALCPGCGVPLPRWMFFKILPHAHYQCGACGCRYQADPLWEWAGDAIGAVVLAVIFLLGWFRMSPWLVAILLSIALLVAAILLFPYLTRFVLVAPADKRTPGHSEPPE